MNKLHSAAHQLGRLEETAHRHHWSNELHPLVKLAVTLLYLVMVLSVDKYSIMSLLGMVLFVVIIFIIFELSLRECLWRLRVILPLVCLVGIANPLLDHSTVMLFGLSVSGGLVSMLTLMLKGVFAVLASYTLIATTGIEGICYALRLLHVPKVFVTQILLTYRYISLLLTESGRMVDAYSLRSARAKGVAFKHWGSFAGLLLLRSVDRANVLYESMLLRGYKGEFEYAGSGKKLQAGDVIYLMFFLGLICLLRFAPVFEIVGRLIA